MNIFEEKQDMQEPPLQQPQVSLPAEEITRPFSLIQAIYPDRKRMKWCAIGSIAVFVFVFLCFPLLFVLNLTTHGSFLEPGDYVPLVLMLVGTVLMGVFAWTFCVYLPFTHQPLLTLSPEGITIGQMPPFSDTVLSGTFLPWAEIETIYSYTESFGSLYLCIRPRNIEQFLSRFTRLERFYLQAHWRVGTPIAMNEQILETPVEAILHQMSFWYASELRFYQVQLRFATGRSAWPKWQ